MTSFVHELLSNSAKLSPEAIALKIKDKRVTYAQLQQSVTKIAHHFSTLGIVAGDRVGIYLNKNQENVESMFSCSSIAAVFVPINPVLKAPQVKYIANDCQIKLLVTNRARLSSLKPLLPSFTSVESIIVIDDTPEENIHLTASKTINLLGWDNLTRSTPQETENAAQLPTSKTKQHIKTSDLAAILYTSGSTGQPKGIMVSHNNIVLGAKSVNRYLALTSDDIILAVLPLSFDYGLNQLMSCFLAGAQCVLFDYLLANDVIKAIARYRITGLAAVPPLWVQLTKATWPTDVAKTVRYFTNSGGVLAEPTLKTLQQCMPQAKPYLMYGLTEAFRSTYLPPEQVTNRPSSMGKAIPNSEILVLRDDGSSCEPNEVGELVHVGPLVTLGYWQNEAATEERFKPTPAQAINKDKSPIAVFSGDYVKYDNEGFLYFISRKDMMIKTSGYRVSPNEVESAILQVPLVEEVAAIASPSVELGQAITVLIVSAATNNNIDAQKELKQAIIKHCQLSLPNYMVPKNIAFLASFPRNANGKVDTKQLSINFNNTSQQN